MRNIVRAYIEKQQLLSADRPVLVGLSGGADSVALLALLVQLDFPCIALHCNFHLRGDESVRDERFAEDMACRLHVPFHKIDFDTTAYATEHHLSIEMAARELRYSWFEEMRQRWEAQAIAVAHHRDDSVETVLTVIVTRLRKTVQTIIGFPSPEISVRLCRLIVLPHSKRLVEDRPIRYR